jgi:hypothetical protein
MSVPKLSTGRRQTKQKKEQKSKKKMRFYRAPRLSALVLQLSAKNHTFERKKIHD